jgi:hypothetical protein
MKEIELTGHERQWSLRDESKEEEKVSNLKGTERIKGRETKRRNGNKREGKNRTESPRKGPQRILWDHIRRTERGRNGENGVEIKETDKRAEIKRRKETKLTS